MYGVFPTADVVTSYVDSFVNRGLPLVIGEFGWVDSDEDAILATAQSRNIGYLSWSWSGNTDPVLDMVVNQNGTFLHDQKTTWGTRIINGPNGLLQTSREATIYSGQTSSPTTSPSPTATRSPTPTPTVSTPSPTPTSSTPAGGCTATYVKVNEWPGGFQGDVRVTNTGTASTTSWSVRLTFANGQRITQSWGGRTTQTASPYTVTNETWNNAIGAGQTVTFGFLGSWTGTNTAPTLTCSRTP
jgi:mannan endo-1,4-beta-mannosidase